MSAHLTLMEALGRTKFRVNHHPHLPEGNTVKASILRGHTLESAAKTIVVRVKITKKKRKYVLAVVQGNQRVDLNAVAFHFGGIEGNFADERTALEMSGCASGSVMPISFRPDVAVIADYSLLSQPEIFFNSGRLDHSVSIAPRHWLSLAMPHLGNINENQFDDH